VGEFVDAWLDIHVQLASITCVGRVLRRTLSESYFDLQTVNDDRALKAQVFLDFYDGRKIFGYRILFQVAFRGEKVPTSE
jgi:hypothetical protein